MVAVGDRKLGERLGVLLTSVVFLWVSVAGSEGVVRATGLESSAEAGLSSIDESAGRAKVLVIGDSVFTAFDHVASAREILDSQQKTIFAVQGCQKLVDQGCLASVKLSALDQLRKHAGKFSDVVVIGTGYNDRIGTAFRRAVLAITTEAQRQGVEVVWVTYRQIGHVRGNSTTRNKQLVKLATNVPNLSLADWNSFSDGKEESGWFRDDKIHLVTPGANGLARLLNEATGVVIAKREAERAIANSTTTTIGG
jgi:hypothetical protein